LSAEEEQLDEDDDDRRLLLPAGLFFLLLGGPLADSVLTTIFSFFFKSKIYNANNNLNLNGKNFNNVSLNI
jgi:hypothetical protein